MSEKRYTYLDYSRDGYIGSFFENDKPLTNKEVFDRLKEQEETIQRLKEELKDYSDDNARLEERIKELEHELNAFKPAVFQDMRKGTILLYTKDYGDVDD